MMHWPALRGGATLRLGPPKPQGSPQKKKKKFKKNLKKIKILPQNLLFLLILAPQFFFFQFDPPTWEGWLRPCLRYH
jgi:hypothetical protein